MATILPNNPIGVHPPETLRVFRALRALPDTFAIWQRLGSGAPSFWVRREDGASALIAVCTASLRDVRAARQTGLFEQQAAPGAAETQALGDFIAALGSDPPDWVSHLPGLVLLPNVPHAELAATLSIVAGGVMWGAREDVSPDVLPSWLNVRLGPPLSGRATDVLRRAFTPEILVPDQLTVRAPRNRGTSAALTDFVLSYDQERVLKHDLDLPDEGHTASAALHVQLVRGVAGSGKSLILLYRARLLRQFFPRKRVLVLTHNKPLIRDLERRYGVLAPGDPGIEWRTFQGWCMANWPEPARRIPMIGSRDRATRIAQVWRRHLQESTLSPEGLCAEIDWVKDRLITTRRGYMVADRSGRGFGLSAPMRERVYAAIVDYQAALQERGQLDFGDVPRRIWRALLEGVPFPRYDVVLMDEAQFFAPIWFEIIRRVLAPSSGHLFMAADPAQGFLRRRQSWLACGIDVRGSSYQLQRCYRTTREILAFATHVYQERLPDDPEGRFGADVQPVGGGLPPQVVTLTTEQDELARVMNEVRALLDAGVPHEHILVIHADWQGAARVLERLRAVFGAAVAVQARDAAAQHQIRVCPIDAVAGLESPIVFLMGAHRLCEAEGSVRITDEERAERVRDNTRRLYMAMTRAGQRLVLTYVGELPPMFQRAAARSAQARS